MILYQEDWDYYPLAIADTTTKNTSFVQYSAVLKVMGIKNHLFPLSLLNPTLQGVDPHDLDSITPELARLIAIECEMNPWYFIREVFRIPPKGGVEGIPLKANRACISLWWAYLNNIDYYLIQPRQTGKSVNLLGIVDYHMHFGVFNTRSTLLTKDNELIGEHIRALKGMRSHLPPYLYTISRQDTDNQRDLSYVARKNFLRGVPSQHNEDMARLAGRGITTPFNIVDEVAYIFYNDVTIPSMLGGTGAARDLAKQLGTRHCNLFATTAGFLDTQHGLFAYSMFNDGFPWNEAVYDSKNAAELETIIKARIPGKAMMFSGEFSHRQLGYTDAWLREKIAESRQSGDLAKADYLNMWPTGGRQNPLDSTTLDKIRNSKRDATYTTIDPKQGYMIQWNIPKDEVLSGIPNRTIVMGLDMSTATGGDSIGGVLMDVSTTEVIGTFKINMTNTHKFAIWLADLLVKYKTITMVPEKASLWVGILDILITILISKGVDPTKRIFSTMVQTLHDGPNSQRMYDNYVMAGKSMQESALQQHRGSMGFVTNSDSRDLLFNILLFEAARSSGSRVYSPDLVSELCTLEDKVVNGKRRIEHATGKHDDLVVSWLLCNWLLTYGKNLSHYGIEPSLVRRSLIESNNTDNWLEQVRLNEQVAKRDELIELLATSKTAPMHTRLKARAKIEKLYMELDASLLDTETISSLDLLLKSAVDNRKIERAGSKRNLYRNRK